MLVIIESIALTCFERSIQYDPVNTNRRMGSDHSYEKCLSRSVETGDTLVMEEKENYEAFGACGISTTRSNGTWLFGCPSPQRTFFNLKFSPARISNRDMEISVYHSNESFITVSLAGFQFGQLIAGMFSGSCVPCTLTPNGPELSGSMEDHDIFRNFSDVAKQSFQQVLKQKKIVDDYITNLKVPQKNKENILSSLDVVKNLLPNFIHAEKTFQLKSSHLETEAIAETATRIKHRTPNDVLEPYTWGAPFSRPVDPAHAYETSPGGYVKIQEVLFEESSYLSGSMIPSETALSLEIGTAHYQNSTLVLDGQMMEILLTHEQFSDWLASGDKMETLCTRTKYGKHIFPKPPVPAPLNTQGEQYLDKLINEVLLRLDINDAALQVISKLSAKQASQFRELLQQLQDSVGACGQEVKEAFLTSMAEHNSISNTRVRQNVTQQLDNIASIGSRSTPLGTDHNCLTSAKFK